MFLITHGKNKGEKVRTEDDALRLLSPEDLAEGGYVHYGSTAFLEGGELLPETITPPIGAWNATRPDPFLFSRLMENVKRA